MRYLPAEPVTIEGYMNSKMPGNCNLPLIDWAKFQLNFFFQMIQTTWSQKFTRSYLSMERLAWLVASWNQRQATFSLFWKQYKKWLIVCSSIGMKQKLAQSWKLHQLLLWAFRTGIVSPRFICSIYAKPWVLHSFTVSRKEAVSKL